MNPATSTGWIWPLRSKSAGQRGATARPAALDRIDPQGLATMQSKTAALSDSVTALRESVAVVAPEMPGSSVRGALLRRHWKESVPPAGGEDGATANVALWPLSLAALAGCEVMTGCRPA